MNVDDHIFLWNQASVRLHDVRHIVMRAGEQLRSYQLPASAFLFSVRGSGLIRLDGNAHAIKNCYMAHAGKGTYVDIEEIKGELEYYLILYKAHLPLPCRQELLRLLEQTQPFHIQYGFTPMHQANVFVAISRMQQAWNQNGNLDKLRAKALLYQLVCELMAQMESQGIGVTVPNLVVQAVRYIEEHYAEAFTLDDFAALLNCSPRSLQRTFKAQLAVGPIDYLIQVRIQKAQELLRQTNLGLKEVAESVGYTDSYYFSRIFKKYTGFSPSVYKENQLTSEIRRQSPSLLSRYSIAGQKLWKYNDHIENENQSHLRSRDGGAVPMYKSTKAMLALNLMLSLTLLLGACSAGGTNTSNTGSTATGATNQVATQSNTTQPATNQEAKKSEPRTIKHMKGELKLDFKPVRIAVLDTQYADQMIALGELPAGSVITTGDGTKFPEYLMDKLKDVHVLGTKDEPNSEAVVAMEPDLIICTEFQDKIYDNLSKIAPTIMFGRNEDWRETLLTFGKILEKEQEAEQIVKDYQEKTSKLKAELATKLKGESVALIRPRDNAIRLHTIEHRTAAILYTDLGLTPPKQAMDKSDTATMISLEVMPELKAGHLFVVTDKANQALTDEYKNSSIWKGLKAAKENKVYEVNTTVWIAYYGPIAINNVVDEIAEALL
ncbi:iron complex transport system substrate-binding protein [Brevibacillus sp. AG162]|uniref:ABC transporter substrate-binding protein n=1 Tax=Brevibacillus sp. AG162 TaxID=2572910 RepID=UPI0011522585|nr:ABC transporter substrate-binding protein [Brevibacillus sp. AG162]TQK63002.1 iron complex transport system substrate-binding protein [Brevibacillus sp. AG162]